ncbi:ThuA domain-containing protein [Actinoplanes sp. TRM 88003]|uniref:ThuA domain-containing protein n=1 Tax=Paractinoplanes aksuensis TaxID=2939490 RepID=A0ABT1DL70_9ACTN|nr:LamG-like jellyroll fold domain-containing protein [Actinoplanes aksuensis]MCO8271591.1 ThuA domain-containing protein [Actinoplanes aksuensis]
MKMPRLFAPLTAGFVALAMVAGSAVPATAAAAPADDGRLTVLLFYKSNFHASHVQARQAVRDLAAQLGTQYNQTVDIQETDDPAAFTTANLATKDTVVFAQTGGVLFNAEQRSALETYIRGGGGYLGLHYAGWSVGQSEHDVNPFYYRLVGAVSEGHPENPGVRPGRVFTPDTGHPLVQGVTPSITRSDEWYDWVVNPAPNVRTLIEADESSYGGGANGSPHPITWCQKIDSGRSWYTAMGHEGSAYAEPYMRAQIKNGLAYAAGLLSADCSPPAPPSGAVRYEFEEGQGTSAANTGTPGGPGAAVLTGTTGWSANGVIGKAINLPGGSTANAVDLPDNLLQNAANFTTGFWVRPDTKNNWTSMFHIGDGLGSAGSYFHIQMQTQASGNTGLAATFKAKTGPEERVYANPVRDVAANQWNHVAFTRQGAVGTLYLNGVAIASRSNLTIGMSAIGPTANNWLGRNGYGDAAFDGLIDDVRTYTSALSGPEVAAMYNEGNAVRYTFDENTGATAGNSGTKVSIGAATLQGTTSWAAGRIGSAVSLPGGGAVSGNQVRLPDNIQAGLTNQFAVSLWARPDTLPNWVPLLQIGSSTDTFFLLQSGTNNGTTGFGATFKASGAAAQERLTLGAGRDLPLNQWTHVVFTMNGSTGKIYFNGVLQATRTNFGIGIGNVGVGGNTTANFIGGTSWGDPRFDGLIDDFRLYGYELSADNVSQLYSGRR